MVQILLKSHVTEQPIFFKPFPACLATIKCANNKYSKLRSNSFWYSLDDQNISRKLFIYIFFRKLFFQIISLCNYCCVVLDLIIFSWVIIFLIINTLLNDWKEIICRFQRLVINQLSFLENRRVFLTENYFYVKKLGPIIILKILGFLVKVTLSNKQQKHLSWFRQG